MKKRKTKIAISIIIPIFIIAIILTGVIMGTNIIENAIIKFMCKDEASSLPSNYDEIIESTDLTTYSYDGTNELDIIVPQNMPNSDNPILVIFHGGYYVGGGRHNQEPFARYIASKGICVANVDYSLAPEHQYPTQIIEANNALLYLSQMYPDSSFVLSGDSAGAHLASQLTAAITNKELRDKIGIVTISENSLAGFIGNCGFYEASTAKDTGFFLVGSALEMLLNDIHYLNNNRLNELDTINFVDNFPPSLLICGDKDPFISQNIAMESAMKAANINIETYFPETTKLELGHEFQCNFNLNECYIAIDRIITFINKL